MDMSNLTTPREIDTALAEQYHKLAQAEQQVAYSASDFLRMAGAKYYYRGRRRVTDMTLEEAMEKVAVALSDADEYQAAHRQPTEGDGYVPTDWSEYKGLIAPYDLDRARKAFPQHEERVAACKRIMNEIDELDRLYTGWSRFFLVTSSTGHVHSSMHCSTCRSTTTYGWLPELSGKTEAEAVAELGPNLCSVCYASAPVEMVGGKITASKAAKLAA